MYQEFFLNFMFIISKCNYWKKKLNYIQKKCLGTLKRELFEAAFSMF